METRTLKTDILIIGGGSAGCMAAIRALEIKPDLKVVIFEKSDIKYSGSIARGMDALNIVAIPNMTSPELYVEAITEGCQNVVDAGPSHLMAARSYDLLKKLQKWGVYFPTDESGNFKTLEISCQGQVSDGHGGAEPEGHDRPKGTGSRVIGRESGDGPRTPHGWRPRGRRHRTQRADRRAGGLPCPCRPARGWRPGPFLPA